MLDSTSPVGGINYRDSVEYMSAEDARILDNWIPTTGFCVLREGETEVVNLEDDLNA